MMEDHAKILVISVSGMGDTLLATPALEELRRLRPQARIDLLIEGSGSRSMLQGNPSINSVFDLGYGKGVKSAFQMAMELRRKRYDMSITVCPSNKPHFGILERLIGARTRVAHSYPDSPAPTMQWLRTHSIPAAGELHQIRQNLHLVNADVAIEKELPRPRVFLEAQDRAFAEELWRRAPPLRPAIAVHPGSGDKPGRRQKAKRWPLENYVETIMRLRRELNASVFMLSGPDEVALLPQLVQSVERAGLEHVHFPQAPIRQIAGLIERCDLLLCNDSGIMHIATALRTPVLALFGPTSPKNTAPVWPGCRVLVGGSCSRLPCYRYPFRTVSSSINCERPICWGSLTPSVVVAEIRTLLSAPRA